MHQNLLRVAALAALIFIRPDLRAQPVLELSFDPNTLVVNSINLTGPLNFTASTNYTYSGIQIRIFDFYPTIPLAMSSSLIGGGFQLTPNALGQAGTLTGITAYNFNLGGSASGGDVILWSPGGYNFTSGQTLTISGQSSIAVDYTNYPNNPLLAPASGQYAIYLASQWDGSLLTVPMNITIAGLAIPEPSAYAVLVGLVALGFAAYRRRCRPAG